MDPPGQALAGRLNPPARLPDRHFIQRFASRR